MDLWVLPILICSKITRTLSPVQSLVLPGLRRLSLTSCFALLRQPSFLARWRNALSSFLIAYIRPCFPSLFIQSKLTGSGAGDGFQTLVSMIMPDLAPSIWSEELRL